jgi:glycosyltransferase involved in cell wall biosynthesis
MTRLIVAHWYPVGSSPSIINLARHLNGLSDLRLLVDERFTDGIPADLQRNLCPPLRDQIGGSLSARRTPSRAPRALYAVRHALPNAFKSEVISLYTYLKGILRTAAKLRRVTGAPQTVCVDKFTLPVFLIAGRRVDFYYSLEATPLGEARGLLLRVLGLIEWIFLRLSKPRLITQTVQRAKALGLSDHKVLLLPVTCYRGACSRSTLLRSRHGVPSDKVVVVVAGGLGSDQLIEEVISGALQCDRRFVFIFHSVNGKFPSLLKNAHKENPTKILLSDLRLTIDEAEDYVFAGADVGIVLYRNLGFNYRNTARSSGKLASFLRAGVPVIVSDYPEYTEALSENRFGVVYDGKSLNKALMEIASDWRSYSRDALIAYRSIYHYARYAADVENFFVNG